MAKRKLLIRNILIVLGAVVASVIALRFLIGGGEDTWICQNGQWIKHGNPASLPPKTGCGEVVCTMEVKECPDGSYVGRVGPRCEFAPCP